MERNKLERASSHLERFGDESIRVVRKSNDKRELDETDDHEPSGTSRSLCLLPLT